MASSSRVIDCGHCEALHEIRIASLKQVGTVLDASANVNWQCDHCSVMKNLCGDEPPSDKNANNNVVRLKAENQLLHAELGKKKSLIARLYCTIRAILGPRYHELEITTPGKQCPKLTLAFDGPSFGLLAIATENEHKPEGGLGGAAGTHRESLSGKPTDHIACIIERPGQQQ